jgi:hypothetical protein
VGGGGDRDRRSRRGGRQPDERSGGERTRARADGGVEGGVGSLGSMLWSVGCRCGVGVLGSCDWEYGAGSEQMGQRRENDSLEPRESRITAIAGAFADALLAADEVAAEIAIREAMDASLSTAEIDEQVIAPALWLVGELGSVARSRLPRSISPQRSRFVSWHYSARPSGWRSPAALAGPCLPHRLASSTWSRFAWSRIFCAAQAMTL